MKIWPVFWGVLLLLGHLGCSSLEPSQVVELQAARLDEADLLLAEVLGTFVSPASQWPLREIISQPGEPDLTVVSRTLSVSSLAWLDRLLPEFKDSFHLAGFLPPEIVSGENLPPGHFAIMTIEVSPGLKYRFNLLQKINAKMAFIIDDMGYSKRNQELLLDLSLPVTLAILPQLPYSPYWDRVGEEHGFEIILHCPLSALNPELDLGPGGMNEKMSHLELAQILSKNLDSLPHAVGCNNHMGSAFTTATEAMVWFLGELGNRDLFFVDSLTVAGTVTDVAARQVQIPVGRRDVFLDHINASSEINAQFDRAVDLALGRGSAIVIGHYRSLTLEILARRLPSLAEAGIQVVPVSALVGLP